MIRIHFSSWPLLRHTSKDVSTKRVLSSLSTLFCLAMVHQAVSGLRRSNLSGCRADAIRSIAFSSSSMLAA